MRGLRPLKLSRENLEPEPQGAWAPWTARSLGPRLIVVRSAALIIVRSAALIIEISAALITARRAAILRTYCRNKVGFWAAVAVVFDL